MKIYFVNIIQLGALLIICCSLSACPVVRGTGNAVQATGEGVGDAITGAGQAIGQTGRELAQDPLH